jgi:hypothetical protein
VGWLVVQNIVKRLPSSDIIFRNLGLLLCCGLSLGGLLLVAVDHHNSNEGAYNRRTQECEDDRDADGPNTGREDVVERVAGVNEGLRNKYQ